MAREVVAASDRLKALTDRFGAEAETFYLNTAGDFCIGIVDGTGTMTTEYGAAPYVEFFLKEGDSAETESVVPGSRYRLTFLGTVMKGRFDSLEFKPGMTFLAMHRGMKRNRANSQSYANIELRVLPSETE